MKKSDSSAIAQPPVAMPEKPQRRGRPPTGQAKTASERSNMRDAELLAAGGRIFNRLRLSPEAVTALSKLRKAGAPTDRAAIEQALIEWVN